MILSLIAWLAVLIGANGPTPKCPSVSSSQPPPNPPTRRPARPRTVPLRRSPKVLALEWGRMQMEGLTKPGMDFKAFPGGAEPWDWSKTRTRHRPGIQVSDVQDLLGRGATSIVLSLGMHARLVVANETLDYLAAQNVAVRVAPTPDAVAIYNSLAEAGERVGALFHSAC